MNDESHLELEITIIQSEGQTLRGLEESRKELHKNILLEFGNNENEITILHAAASRTLDPDALGTIGLILLPVVVDQLLNVLIHWLESKNDCMVLIKIPMKGRKPIEIIYNPKHTSPDKLKSIISSTMDVVTSTKKRQKKR